MAWICWNFHYTTLQEEIVKKREKIIYSTNAIHFLGMRVHKYVQYNTIVLDFEFFAFVIMVWYVFGRQSE